MQSDKRNKESENTSSLAPLCQKFHRDFKRQLIPEEIIELLFAKNTQVLER